MQQLGYASVIVGYNAGTVTNCINATDKNLFYSNFNNDIVTNSYTTSGIAITLPTETNIKVNDGVTSTTYDNVIMTAAALYTTANFTAKKLNLSPMITKRFSTLNLTSKVIIRQLLRLIYLRLKH